MRERVSDDEYTRQTQGKCGCYNMEFMKNVAKRLFYLGILLVTGLIRFTVTSILAKHRVSMVVITWNL